VRAPLFSRQSLAILARNGRYGLLLAFSPEEGPDEPGGVPDASEGLPGRLGECVGLELPDGADLVVASHYREVLAFVEGWYWFNGDHKV
jgi:hypothetical protein